ncbi:uncharacterized protein LOC141973479 [Athene noctua]|uniref:uncharacterized protein LOC141973479 n=1 Tax=Athene noctua TaxID=126797 RepID=UPI003EBBD548
MSPRDGRRHSQAMGGDRASLAARTRTPSLTPPARARAPAARVCEVGVRSEAFAGAGEDLHCNSQCPTPEPLRDFPRHCLDQQPWHPGGALAAAECAVAVSRSSSTSPAPPSPPQHVESMAAELENCSPVCLDSWEKRSYVLPCLHQFFCPCIVRWAESKPECPLCKRKVRSILHSVWADSSFEEYVITPPAAPSLTIRLTGGACGHPAAPSSRGSVGQLLCLHLGIRLLPLARSPPSLAALAA